MGSKQEKPYPLAVRTEMNPDPSVFGLRHGPTIPNIDWIYRKVPL